ncbi:plasmid mobilization protein [Aquabacterium commune]|uniref:plasmid mobilization protein n=1 Tax=Aquabacterium commune TaxID=70586 RepID=UPI003BAE7BC4
MLPNAQSLRARRVARYVFVAQKRAGLRAVDLAGEVLTALPPDTLLGAVTPAGALVGARGAGRRDRQTMARPRKASTERRTFSFGLRLSATERAALNAAAAQNGLTPAALLRASFLTTPKQASAISITRPAARPLDAAVVAGLGRIGANLNQLARRANAGDLLQPGELPDALAALGRQLDRIEALVMVEVDR